MSDKASARELFLREKARRSRKSQAESDLIEQAKAEYEALLQAEAEKGKGGRPKKKRPAAEASDAAEDADESD